jgi:hypothetical protein
MLDARTLISRLEARRAQPVPEAQAMAVAEHLLRYAAVLGLDRPDDVLEVFDLWLTLVEQAPRSLYVHGMLRIVISIKRWPVAARVAFLRRHLVGREVTPADEAEARVLFGVSAEPST